jgi:DNA-directed RNA polymerase specialized sigma54-like protein
MTSPTRKPKKPKAAAPDQESAASKPSQQQADDKAIRSRSTSTEAQEDRTLALLRTGPQTTYSLRKHGIAQTSARIWDLRDRGHLINTELVNALDSDGYMHTRVARYSLLREAGNDPQMELPTEPPQPGGADQC